ncbi:MAG: T9SS type A sorting domain-containing protein, partial [Bacteroidota bacterium]
WNDGPVFRVFTPNITRNVQVMYKNDFNGTSAFGKMYFISDGTISGGSVPIPGDEVKLTITVPANGFEKYYFYGEKQKVEAFTPQEIAGNKYVFNNNWTAFGANLEGNKQTLIIYEDGDVTAHFGNSTTYTVQVSLFGDGETLDSYLKVGGVVTNVNGTTTAQYSSGNAILEAYPSLVLYGVVYQFSHWNTGSTSTTITASPNSSYAAYYNFHSVNPPSSFRIASLPGDPGIVLRWNEMLSPYITLLELWSKTKNTSYQLLETLPDSATRYVDSRYSISTVSQENNIGLEYQLKAKYVKPAVRTVWVQGGLFEWVSDDGVLPFERAKEEEMNAITLENALDAYPNPFNPSVVLRVQLKEAAHVSVVLYDITGRRVKQPMSGIFDAGAHDFTWNTQEDGYLPSGVYFAKMDLAPLSGGVPQQFVKKLMLSK